MTKSSFTVEFRIYGKALNPDAITDMLQLKPCQVALAGSRLGSRTIQEAMWAFNGFEDDQANTPEWATLEEGLTFVLNKLWSRREIISHCSGATRLIWWCAHFQTVFDSGITLSAPLLARLSEFGADLFIDNYFSDN